MLAPLSRAVSKTLGPYTPNERSQRRYFSRRGNENTPTARRGSLATAKSTRPTALAVTAIPAEDAAAIADPAGADADASSSSTAELPIPPKPFHVNNKGWQSYDIHKNKENGNVEIIPTSRTLICKDTTQTFIDDDEPITCLVFIILIHI